MTRLDDIEGKYGTRPRIPIGHGEPMLQLHARGEMMDGQKFVWCPVGYIFSWHPNDYDNKWCHWCSRYFHELQKVPSA